MAFGNSLRPEKYLFQHFRMVLVSQVDRSEEAEKDACLKGSAEPTNPILQDEPPLSSTTTGS